MGKCKRRMLIGEDCGLSTDAEFCRFHSLKVVTNEDRRIYEDYLDNTPHKLIDLSSIEFEDITFGKNGFSLKTPVDFTRSKFTNCVFNTVGFDKQTCFRGAVFKGTHFFNTTFECDTIDFAGCTFDGDDTPFVFVHMRAKTIRFDGCKFQSRQDAFSLCWFRTNYINFSEAYINSDRLAICNQSTSSDNIPYEPHPLMLISDHIDLSSLRFDGHFYFTQEGIVSAPEIILTKTHFAGMRSATFSDVDLRNSNLDGITLGNTRFINVRWDERAKRKVLRDDKHSLIESGSLQRLVSTYIQLKKNFEEARDFIGAGDWFYREMECRRRLAKAYRVKHPWLGLPGIILYQLYKLVSEYGENYARPLWGLIITLFLGATSYFYSGFVSEKNTISYDFACPPTAESFWGFVDALAYSGGIMLFQSVKVALALPFPTPQLAIAQILLTLILVPLFLLALRRKFRR